LYKQATLSHHFSHPNTFFQKYKKTQPNPSAKEISSVHHRVPTFEPPCDALGKEFSAASSLVVFDLHLQKVIKAFSLLLWKGSA